ncbi:hypothetical protein BOTBODRAFT_55366 [Botryobasidium botryosum FD-172 SS1]|uniref:FAD/NAD(P)-binding domain-containing protein n=1 Tax=Botryobasidium botryosum (strain FD-172 SS1) TaxID=930990 RepID=A0A067MSG6_BOTB1|nr:hypothetical protein BOTBODRAFT_55366 [Botryobasidium botryosum FD-172 SS1]
MWFAFTLDTGIEELKGHEEPIGASRQEVLELRGKASWQNDHLPYVPFPETWLIFTPKEKFADWLESYARTLDLNIWTPTTLVGSSYDEASSQWTVVVERSDGTRKTLRPKHIILATGITGPANVPTPKGSEIFKGPMIHSSGYKNAHGLGRKKAADIARDFSQEGADVTVVQRSTTLVCSSAAVLNVYFKGVYDGAGPSTEVADHIVFSLPWAANKGAQTFLTDIERDFDGALHEGLQKAGFKLDFGPENSGIMFKLFDEPGSYFVDAGCGQLIVDGKVKIDHFEQDGIVFDDGTKLNADAVILATGWLEMSVTAAQLFGKEVAERAGEISINDEGEFKGIWMPSGQPGLWHHSGGISFCRFYSKRLALHIKANLLGLTKPWDLGNVSPG